ncbi:activated RNA polymerase II transcriptional coactivator p15 [Elysia marginata]|uniref:Activated RNA polymerase II transcriptional coactivator p15 n=1 Tax=Elysia marginata TaxID=1093978 RepID=A0AAV4ELJ2_9GAST|nr:activated RNA polymerase II transcriptional coactivator p15 [Elysia marginata]
METQGTPRPNLPLPTMYPLGRNVYLSVKSFRGVVKIHIREYLVATDVKSKKVIPTRKGVALEKKQFEQLIQLYSRIVREYDRLNSTKENNPDQTWAAYPKENPPNSPKRHRYWPTQRLLKLRKRLDFDDKEGETTEEDVQNKQDHKELKRNTGEETPTPQQNEAQKILPVWPSKRPLKLHLENIRAGYDQNRRTFGYEMEKEIPEYEEAVDKETEGNCGLI